ncbi:thioesterase domain-containing protein [Serratia ureilytica]
MAVQRIAALSRSALVAGRYPVAAAGRPLALSEDMDQVVDAHLQTVLQVQPHGPYHFIGYSLGGTLAQGIAARLQARGEQVAFLGLLDTYPPETQTGT